MGIEQTVQRYFAGWNAHDAKSIAGLLAPDAIYEDPTTRMAVRSYDLASVVSSVAKVLPDFRFEIVSVLPGTGRTVVEWILHGTNSEPLKPGIEPMGKAIHLSGVEVLEGAERITRVTRYFDQKSMYEQMGLQVIVEPFHQGKAVFGYSKRVPSGNPSVPSVVGMTWIRFRDQSELDHIRRHSAQIIQDFLEEPGFISIVTGAAGDRAFTVTAWETEDAMHRALDRAHSSAKHDFRTSDLSPGVWTSVWKPHHINRLWTRCPYCNQPNDVSDDRRVCSNCGGTLPDRPMFW